MTTDRVEVPFLALHGMHAGIKEEILADIADLIETSAFSNGPAVAEFERAFAQFCGTSTYVGVASGLDALRLALIAAEIEPGDEVIVPANTFIATVEAVTQAGGRPVLADVSLAAGVTSLGARAQAHAARCRQPQDHRPVGSRATGACAAQ